MLELRFSLSILSPSSCPTIHGEIPSLPPQKSEIYKDSLFHPASAVVNAVHIGYWDTIWEQQNYRSNSISIFPFGEKGIWHNIRYALYCGIWCQCSLRGDSLTFAHFNHTCNIGENWGSNIISAFCLCKKSSHCSHFTIVWHSGPRLKKGPKLLFEKNM